MMSQTSVVSGSCRYTKHMQSQHVSVPNAGGIGVNRELLPINIIVTSVTSWIEMQTRVTDVRPCTRFSTQEITDHGIAWKLYRDSSAVSGTTPSSNLSFRFARCTV